MPLRAPGNLWTKRKLATSKQALEDQITRESDPYFATASLVGRRHHRPTRYTYRAGHRARRRVPSRRRGDYGMGGIPPLNENPLPNPDSESIGDCPPCDAHMPQKSGIETVAVFTAADHHAMHVREATMAVPISSYLNPDEIVAAARRTGADAIHPGYGFLAENAEFAEACEHAGIVFIGPPAPVIRLAGSKIRAREAVAAAGVPVVPAIDPARPDFPLLVKASAGGGGRGMRLVHESPMLEAALESAGREAVNAFGDGALVARTRIHRRGASH